MPINRTLVIAPHPDDELLGCGGMLIRRGTEGVSIGWMIVTEISIDDGWSADNVRERQKEIQRVRKGLGVHSDYLFQLGFSTTRLDTVPMSDLVSKISEVFQNFQPEEVLIPHRGDVHSDHRIVFDAVAACTKWFRYPSVKRVLVYETLSETEFGLDPNQAFRPNVFVDITLYLENKLKLLHIYRSELGKFPFPRSEPSLKALAQVRGANSGFEYAEAFQLLLERN